MPHNLDNSFLHRRDERKEDNELLLFIHQF
jgi:hypothetical protein